MVIVAYLKIRELGEWSKTTKVPVLIIDFEWDFNWSSIMQREDTKRLPQISDTIVYSSYRQKQRAESE
jgi:hypothetical protein